MFSNNKFGFALIAYFLIVLIIAFFFNFSIKYIIAFILFPSIVGFVLSDLSNNFFYLIPMAFVIPITFYDRTFSTISIIVFLWVFILFAFGKLYLKKITPQMKIFFLLFLISFFISLLFANNKNASLHWFLIFSQYLIFFIGFASVLSLKLLERIFYSFLIPFTASILIGFKNILLFGSGSRLSGFVGNSNIYGAYLAFNLLMIIYLISTSHNKYLSIFLFIMLFAGSINIVFTFSRGAQLGYIVSLMTYLFLKNLHRKKIILILFTFFFIFLVLLIIAFPNLFHRYTNIKVDNMEYSEIDRLSLYFSGIKLFLNKPIYGIGVNNFHFEYEKYHFLNTVLKNKVNVHFHPHNIFINVLANQGIIGFLVYLYFFYIFMKFVFFNKNKIHLNDKISEMRIFVISFFAYFIVHGQFDVIWTIIGRHQMHLLFMIWLGMVNYLIKYKNDSSHNVEKLSPSFISSNKIL